MKVDVTKNYYMVGMGPNGLNDKVITLKPTCFPGGTLFKGVEENFIVWSNELKSVMDNRKDFDGSDDEYTWFVFEKRSAAMQTLRALKAYRNHVRRVI